MTKVYILPGETAKIKVAYSEAAMHLKVSGKSMNVRLGANHMAVLMDDNGMEYAVVTPGEAGLYYDDTQKNYYYHREN
jgi:hypothetical protein